MGYIIKVTVLFVYITFCLRNMTSAAQIITSYTIIIILMI